MTSSPGPISIASSTSTSASVPFATPIVLRHAEIGGRLLLERPVVLAADEVAADSRTSRKRASSSGISGAYCALTSMSGIVGTAIHFSGPQPPPSQVRRQQENACNDDVFGVFERVVEVLVAGAERVARPGDREGPDRRADRGSERCRSPSGISSTPAGIETNERMTGVIRPTRTPNVAPPVEPAPRPGRGCPA